MQSFSFAQAPDPNINAMEEVNRLIFSITPVLTQVVMLLKEHRMTDMQLVIGSTGERLTWYSSTLAPRPVHESELIEQLAFILDREHPPTGEMIFNRMWSKNYALAKELASILVEYRRRDESEVEAKILEMVKSIKGRTVV